MGANAVVRARISEKDKNEATAVLDEIGLSITDVIRFTVTFVARNHKLPFEINVPNEATQAAINEARTMSASRKLRFAAPQDLIDALDEKNGKRKTREAPENL